MNLFFFFFADVRSSAVKNASFRFFFFPQKSVLIRVNPWLAMLLLFRFFFSPKICVYPCLSVVPSLLLLLFGCGLAALGESAKSAVPGLFF